ncbi:MAG TPA: aldolase/citrate lyase family protein [Rhizomicrobium sp.]|jgi:4-hydroxy-2-oxoheptanedioate aldolase|nr:aldolase/citrate lyase family protein [Rhizomicrobium sp.]
MTNPRRRLKEKFARREMILGVSPDYPSAGLVEFLGRSGFDLIFIDCEHAGPGIENLVEMARAVRAAGAVSVARPWSNEPGLVRRFLDCGVDGLIAPDMETAADARAILKIIADSDPPDAANIIFIPLIESAAGIENLGEILGVDGVDGIQVGPGDLAVSLNLPRRADNAKVHELTFRVFGEAKAAGKSCGGPVNRFGIAPMMDAGANFPMFWVNDLLRAGIETALSSLK